MKLTEIDRRILAALQERPLDLYDLGDKCGVQHAATHRHLNSLRSAGLIHRMYPEDEASLTPAGRAALQEGKE